MKPTLLLAVCLITLFSCKENSSENCPTEDQIEVQFIQKSGEELIIDRDGKVYEVEADGCTYLLDYYSADFRSEFYDESTGEILIRTSEGNTPILKSFDENFESYTSIVDLFYLTFEEIGDKVWGEMVLQSPSAKTVEEYVELRKCILEGNCDFIDNRIELVTDPTNSNNTCLKFTAVDKTNDMVTCKSSISSGLLFFEKGDDLWFTADYLIQENLPITLADFENKYFEGSPGPRIIIKNNRLAIENKFGEKVLYEHDKNITVPMNEWFNLKVHFTLSEKNDGLIELWQDDALLFSLNGLNIPLSKSIQNSVEVGISATNEKCTVYLDNLKVDHNPL